MKNWRPSEEFEQEFGFTGLSVVYAIPDSAHLRYESDDPRVRAGELEPIIRDWMWGPDAPGEESLFRRITPENNEQATRSRRLHFSELKGVVNELLQANPRLAETLNSGYPQLRELLEQPEYSDTACVQFSDIVHGVCSGFIPRDITYYLAMYQRAADRNGGVRPDNESPILKDPEIHPGYEGRQKLIARLGTQDSSKPNWAPAPETLAEINRRLDARETTIPSEKADARHNKLSTALLRSFGVWNT